ncbi:hypothetical protein F441_16713 [Phytophthora nicotianae CJ01A1]|nr:hypothetical protein F443_16873 [Phytophthora nicotianae P1569]ETL30761.1 hypothetical protein L916_16301 [Phytophthora nicotianae]ETP06956.1 hypothetical protein F441_16713 [Phytophthora nicotianae CJ01A1]ETP35045.1 hypothetical protein F442_16705 [Phytophthora nicotianae P10297]ETL84006.1 hypothetical protein L917_16112 [Phytophthora nicotianae]
MASPRGFERDGDNNAELRCSISSDGKWPSLKREDVLLEGTQSGGGSTGYADSTLQGGNNAMNGALTIPVSCEGSASSSSHSDWHAISSNSFDETYLESDYGSGGTTGMSMSSSSSSLSHLNEPMNKLALESEEHDMPVISMPYPGSSWFLGGKTENGFCLPSLGGLTPRSQALSAVTTEISATFSASCPPSAHSSGVDYSATGKLAGDAGSCPSSAHSPETMTPCLPHTLEPSELLFEDMSTWSGPPADTYDNQHYHQQQGQPFYNVTSHPPAPNGYLYFDSATQATSSAMSTPLHDYTPSYQHHPLPSAGPSLYRLMQGHESFPSDSHWSSNQAHGHYSTPSTASSTPTESVKSQNQHAAEQGNTIKRILRSSTLNQRLPSTGSMLLPAAIPKPNNPMTMKPMPLPSTNPVSPNQSARIQLLTALNDCYWKNGRKNLQCFPSCPEHHDFYSMKMNNRKHSSVGVCRGPVYCHAFTDASEFLPAASTQQMKHEHGGVPSGGNNARELFVLGRFERVPQQETTNLLEELNAPPSFPNAAVFEQFRFTCFQAVEMEERRVLLPESPESKKADKRFIRSTWFFLPDVWKVQPMLKKKRKATRSAPAQTFPFCFRIFIYTRDVNGPGYSCIADAASSFFELYSTRTVDRVKRKYWSGESSSDQRKRV